MRILSLMRENLFFYENTLNKYNELQLKMKEMALRLIVGFSDVII